MKPLHRTPVVEGIFDGPELEVFLHLLEMGEHLVFDHPSKDIRFLTSAGLPWYSHRRIVKASLNLLAGRQLSQEGKEVVNGDQQGQPVGFLERGYVGHGTAPTVFVVFKF